MNNDSVSPICQFKYQLSELLETFRWIPQSDQATAFLAVEDLISKLKLFCSYQKTGNGGDGPQNETDQFETEKSTEKVFTSLVPLDTFDVLDIQRSSDAAMLEDAIGPNATQSMSLNTFPPNSEADLKMVQQTESSTSVANSSLSVPCGPEAAYSELVNAAVDAVVTPVPHEASLRAIVTEVDEESAPATVCDVKPEVGNELSSEPAYLQLVPYTGPVQGFPVAQFETIAEGGEVEVESLPCDVHAALSRLQNGMSDTSEGTFVLLEVASVPAPQSGEGTPVPLTLTLAGRVTRSMVRGSSKRPKGKGQGEPKKRKTKRQAVKDDTSPDAKSADAKLQDVSIILDQPEESGSCDDVRLPSKPVISGDHTFARVPLEADSCSPCGGAVSCRHCRAEFESVDALNAHGCSRTRRTCAECNLSFSHRQRYLKHVDSHKRNDCQLCDARFTKRKALGRHSRSEHGVAEPKRYYHCPYCERQYPKRPALYAHLTEHAGTKTVCQKCGAMCDGAAAYEQHALKHTEEVQFRCAKCDEGFVRRQQYEQHMLCHNKYDCSLCGTHFSTKKQVLRHRRLVHGMRQREEKRHECPLCAKKFRRPTLLEVHVRVHTGEKPLQCQRCDKKFRTPKSLARHLKSTAHLKACGGQLEEPAPPDADRTFLCAQCGAKFYRKQGLSRHMQQLHSEERPYECNFCDYKCKCKTNLKRHIELHKDERRFVCELCAASFHAHATLKEHHAYVHSDVRGFVCPSCGKGFKGRSGLRRHIRSHSDARPYVCYCGQSYKRMSHLKRHMSAIHSLAFKSKRVQRIASEYPSFALLDDSSSSIPFQGLGPDGLLVVEDPKQPPAELATFEVTAHTATQMHVVPGARDLSDTGRSADDVAAPLPSIAETAELRHAFDLSGVVVPCGGTVPATCQTAIDETQTVYHAIETLTPTSDADSEIPTLECQQTLQALPPEFYTQSLAQLLSM